MDTFGFENLRNNCYEQLLVNTTNEELQNAFYRHSFAYEQSLYQHEGIPFPPVSYKDNKKTVDLLLQVEFEKKNF